MKEVIVSIYDGGYNWSIHINNRTYHRDDEFTKTPIRVRKLFNIIYNAHYLNMKIQPILKLHKIDRLIICEDGTIEIYNK